MIDELIRKKWLQQFVKSLQDSAHGNSNPHRSTYQRRQAGLSGEEPRQIEKRLVNNTIIGGPHPADKSLNKMGRYVGALKHTENESCLTVDDGASIKQFRTMTDGIVFRNRDDDGM